MYNEDRKYIMGPLLAGLGAGFGIRNNMIFQFAGVGGAIGLIIDLIVVRLFFNKKNNL